MYRHILLFLLIHAAAAVCLHRAAGRRTLAFAHGAKETFFHAQSDYASRRACGALERVNAANRLQRDGSPAKARALLAKAEVVPGAHAHGVPHDAFAIDLLTGPHQGDPGLG